MESIWRDERAQEISQALQSGKDNSNKQVYFANYRRCRYSSPRNPFKPTVESSLGSSRSHKGDKFFKNCREPKLVERVRMCNLQSAKNCASVETSQATVHARAQEMEKRDGGLRRRIYTPRSPRTDHPPTGILVCLVSIGSRLAFPVSGDQMLASIVTRPMAPDPFVVFGYGSLIFKVSGMRFTRAKTV